MDIWVKIILSRIWYQYKGPEADSSLDCLKNKNKTINKYIINEGLLGNVPQKIGNTQVT